MLASAISFQRQFLVDPLMKTPAEASRQFEHPLVRQQHHHIPRRIKHGRANLAGLQMTIDFSAQFGLYLAIDIRRDILPHVFAVDSHEPHPKSPLLLGANPFNFGASALCKMARARCSLTLTAPSEMPSAPAISRTSISSMSLSITTLR